MSKAQRPATPPVAKEPTVETPTVETQDRPVTDAGKPFEEEFIPNGQKVATITHNPNAVIHTSGGSQKAKHLFNASTGMVIKLSHQAAIELIQSDPEKFLTATQEQVDEYILHNETPEENGE